MKSKTLEELELCCEVIYPDCGMCPDVDVCPKVYRDCIQKVKQ